MPRKRTDAAKAPLAKALRNLFRALEQRPVPDRLRSVVDQLDESEADQPEEGRARRRR